MGASFIAGLILTLAACVAAAGEITVISGGAARALVDMVIVTQEVLGELEGRCGA